MSSTDKVVAAIVALVIGMICATILWITLANNAAQRSNLQLCLASGGSFVPGTSGESSSHEPMECRR